MFEITISYTRCKPCTRHNI